jgi:hypothetical protein
LRDLQQTVFEGEELLGARALSLLGLSELEGALAVLRMTIDGLRKAGEMPGQCGEPDSLVVPPDLAG